MASKLLSLLVAVLLLLAALGHAQDVEVDAEADEFPQLGRATSQNRYRETASERDPGLMRAASHGDLDLMLQFLRAGQPVNAANSQGWTALVFGVANGYIDIVNEVPSPATALDAPLYYCFSFLQLTTPLFDASCCATAPT